MGSFTESLTLHALGFEPYAQQLRAAGLLDDGEFMARLGKLASLATAAATFAAEDGEPAKLQVLQASPQARRRRASSGTLDAILTKAGASPSGARASPSPELPKPPAPVSVPEGSPDPMQQRRCVSQMKVDMI